MGDWEGVSLNSFEVKRKVITNKGKNELYSLEK